MAMAPSKFAFAGAALVVGAALLTPAPAFAAQGDSSIDPTGRFYTETIYEGYPPFLRAVDWVAECPSDFPWLEVKAGTAGKHMGQGVIVEEPGGVDVYESPNSRGVIALDGGRWGYSVNKGKIVNAAFWTAAFVKITMVCTKDPSRAWQHVV